MKVLVLMGSPRRNGNTSILCDEFIRGAMESGHETEKINIVDLKVNGCLGCNGCQRNGGTCVQKDDMAGLYDKIMAADVVVLASPIYYYTWTAQMKAVIDRTYALLGRMQNKKFYMISACGAPSEEWNQTMLASFRQYLGCYDETVTEGGYVFGLDTMDAGSVRDKASMEQAYQLGRAI
ncbi:MAG: flavodoxin family protein [Eubacteriales bacterium]|nr:flavodoxin family protein [Eubacteriales bacterium]